MDSPQLGGVLDPSRNLSMTGAVESSKSIKSIGAATVGGIGYGTGAGSSVTQATNRSTAVTINAPCGLITTNNASLAAEASAAFTVNNSAVELGDVVVVAQRSGSDGGNTAVNVTTVAAGSFAIRVSNNNAAAGTAETGPILINFAVIKAVSV